MVIPSGRVTSTFFGCPSAIASLFSKPAFGMSRRKLRPLGFSASLLDGAASILGSKGIRLQPCRGSLVDDALSTAEPIGTFQGSASTPNSSGLEH